MFKRDVRKAGEEKDWKKKTRDRGGWKRLSDEKVAGSTSPLTKGKEEEREAYNRKYLCLVIFDDTRC